MRKYICSLSIAEIIEADNKNEACDIFTEKYELNDTFVRCKEYRKEREFVRVVDMKVKK